VRRALGWIGAAGLTALVLAVLWPGPNEYGGLDRAVGTAGYGASSEPEDSPTTLHDLETMTGIVDQHQLVGSRVDFYAKVADVADAMSFWIGMKDNRVPVTATTRVTPGQFVRIIGTIETKDQEVYIRADSVTPD
jgi:hypothetical protein